VSTEVQKIAEPLRIASALTLVTPDDAFRHFDATDEFKQTMAQRLNGAVAPGCVGLALRTPFPRGAHAWPQPRV
jgi:hypothetical protein